jgi:hypothetical protein
MSRTCGDCSLCCTLLPVQELGKLANARCAFQKFHKGCSVYFKPQMPVSCSIWNCRWLVNDDTNDLSRPDRSHLVIDVMPDYIRVTDNTTGIETTIEVVQVWCDPKHRDAHRSEQFRRYVERRCVEGKLVLVRFNSREAVALWPPSASSDNQWHEVGGNAEGQHTFEDVVTRLAQ